MPVLLLRLPWSAIRARRKTKLALDETSVVTYRVRLTDTDWYGHMNNGRYLTNLDLGRTDFCVRIGLFSIFTRLGWRPVVAGATVRFRRSLNTFTKYTMSTRLLGWDTDWWFFEQQLHDSEGKLAGHAWVKVAVMKDRGRGARVTPDEAIAELGYTGEPFVLPPKIAHWQSSGVG
ncbi:MAG: thioesterase family protein [Thermoleophilia bacterium]|nr:thioesterase family protein [Thermoleophilia bacterium]